MSWIEEIPFEQAQGKLKMVYDRVVAPNGHLDNILSVHSLRPHSLTGHMALYKNILHHKDNQLPKWYLESVGVYVSRLNACGYCVAHHAAGLQKLLGNAERFASMEAALLDEPAAHFQGKELAGLHYAKSLTLQPQKITQAQVHRLRKEGYSDGEILELNQVVSYFNYANRTVLGLGVTTQGDVLGLSPNDNADENNWNHT